MRVAARRRTGTGGPPAMTQLIAPPGVDLQPARGAPPATAFQCRTWITIATIPAAHIAAAARMPTLAQGGVRAETGREPDQHQRRPVGGGDGWQLKPVHDGCAR